MLRASLFLTFLVSLGCASGQKTDVTLPELEPGKSRIVFYRVASPFGANDQPEILLDRRLMVGKSEPGTFSYVDVSPGKHAIESKADKTYLLGVYLTPGATAYVETSATLATARNESEARPKIRGLRFRPPLSVPQPPPTTRPTTAPQIPQ